MRIYLNAPHSDACPLLPQTSAIARRALSVLSDEGNEIVINCDKDIRYMRNPELVTNENESANIHGCHAIMNLPGWKECTQARDTAALANDLGLEVIPMDRYPQITEALEFEYDEVFSSLLPIPTFMNYSVL